jgi:hypothetical protein
MGRLALLSPVWERRIRICRTSEGKGVGLGEGKGEGNLGKPCTGTRTSVLSPS